MANVCLECGAIHTGDGSCQAIFDNFLALEFSEPGFGEVHLLTVACFMIQHGRYSDEALIWIEQQLRANLEGGVSAEQIRRRAAQHTDLQTRVWKVTRRPGAPSQAHIAWSMTIADVAAHYQDAATYRDLVSQWARATLREMKPLLSKG
jgi:hypothetical protein